MNPGRDGEEAPERDPVRGRGPEKDASGRPERGPHPKHPWVLRLRCLMLGLLPREFRVRYREEMEAAFREVLEDAEGRWGAAGVMGALARETLDLLVAAVRLRREDRGSRGRRRGRGEAVIEIGRELRVALRTLARRPAFALVAAGTVALGVAASTAMFAVVEGVLLRPLPYPEPDRLIHVFQTSPELGWERGPVSFPNFHDWRTEADVFQSLSAYQMGLRRTLMVDGVPRQVSGSRVTGELFRTLGAPALHGRTLTHADEGPGAAPTVVLSHGLWQDAFGGDPGVVGRSVTLGDDRHTVVGVMPADFPTLWEKDQLWIPFPFVPDDLERGQNFLTVLGRLKPGVTPAEAESYMEDLMRRMEGLHPEGNRGRSAHVETRAEVVTGHVEKELLVLFAAVGLLLVITCANLAGLMLVRGTARARELAVRAVLGAGRARLARELLVESLAVALVGAVLAIPLARVLIGGLLVLGPADLPRRGEIGLGGAALAFALCATLVSAAAFGLLPALRFSRRAVAPRLTEGRGRSGPGGVTGLQRGLVVVQVALAVALIIGAGLLGESLLRLQSVERGFDGEGVLTFRIHPPEGRYREAEELDAFYRGILDGIEALPRVAAAGATWALPFGEAFGSSTYMLEGRPDDEAYLLELVPIRGDYFRALGVPLLGGRGFEPGDGREGELVTIVNQAFAQQAWPGDDPVGKKLRKGSGEDAVFIEVVGVVPNVTMRALGEKPLMQSFWPHAATPWATELYFTVRARAGTDPMALLPAVRQAVGRVDEGVPVAEVSSMAGRIRTHLAEPRFRAILVAAFAVTAGLLALLGIYGVTSFVVARRSHEIGIRMALGARKSGVRVRIMFAGLGLALLGTALGLAMAAAGSRVVESLLFGTAAVAPGIYGAAAALIMLATLAATWFPARRASRVDPVEALRMD